jgi:hypothetical protein
MATTDDRTVEDGHHGFLGQDKISLFKELHRQIRKIEKSSKNEGIISETKSRGVKMI